MSFLIRLHSSGCFRKCWLTWKRLRLREVYQNLVREGFKTNISPGDATPPKKFKAAFALANTKFDQESPDWTLRVRLGIRPKFRPLHALKRDLDLAMDQRNDQSSGNNHHYLHLLFIPGREGREAESTGCLQWGTAAAGGWTGRQGRGGEGAWIWDRNWGSLQVTVGYMYLSLWCCRRRIWPQIINTSR